MGNEDLLVKEYLESLKEDGELDRIFPHLLTVMGLKVIATPKDSKGQPQYGKDVIATGIDRDGIKKRFYFELKGEADKDIDDTVFNKKDGIRESLQAAIDKDYSEISIPKFNELPVKVILVHNGHVKRNTQQQFDDFIKKNFPANNFERWGIETLTELFSKYLFGEYLMADEESSLLLKRTLVLLDVPEYDLADLKILVDAVLNNEAKVRTRSFNKMFATLNLVGAILFHYAQKNNNLAHAKDGIHYIVLQTWSWILRRNLEKKRPVRQEFEKLLRLQHQILHAFFQKTLPLAVLVDGLASETGQAYETIGYPLRAMDYVVELIYFYYLERHFAPTAAGAPASGSDPLRQAQKAQLFTILLNNDGCVRPLLDRHSLPILMVILFLLESPACTDEDRAFVKEYMERTFRNIIRIREYKGRFPEFNNNVTALIESYAMLERSFDYQDDGSFLLTIFLELLILSNDPSLYATARVYLSGKVDLQSAYPLSSSPELESKYFQGNINELVYPATSIPLPEDLAAFIQYIKSLREQELPFKTDAVGFPFLKFLAAFYHQNDIFPDQWRKLIPLSAPSIGPAPQPEISAT